MDEEIKKLIEALTAQGAVSADLNAKLDALTDAQLKNAEAAARAADISENRAQKALKQEIAFREQASKTLEDQEMAIRSKMETMGKESDIARSRAELLDIEIQKLELLSKSEEGMTDAIRENIAALKEQKKELGEVADSAEELEGIIDDLGGSIGNMLGGSAPSIDSLLNPANLQKGIKGFQNLKASGIGAAKAMSMLGRNVAFKGITALVSQTAKLAVKLKDGESSFMRATNASKDFARNITLTYEEGRKFAQTSDDMFDSAAALTRAFTDFTFQTQEAQRDIVYATTALDKMGLSNESVASSLQLMTKSFGMTGKQGVKQLTNLEKFSTNLGVPLEKLGSDFQAAGGDLAKLGDNGMEAFKGLAKTMKVTGLEMNKILNLTRQFDTFEGAARSAGKLNAALGGNFVNAMDLMMETDPAERLNMMRDSILDAGLSFDEMSYYQRNFYKDALGLGDVSDLAALLSGDMDDVTDATMKSSQEMKELRDRARETASFQEQLNAVFAQMIPILTPLIDMLSSVATFLSENVQVIQVLGAALIGFGVGGPLGAVIGALGTLGLTFGNAVEQTTVFGQVIEGLLFPFRAIVSPIVSLIGYVKELWNEYLSPMLPTIEDAGNKFKYLGMVIGAGLLVPLAALLAPIVGISAAMIKVGAVVMIVVSAFTALGNKLFKETFASNFLDGVVKLANAFGSIAEKILPILNPITSLKELVSQLGNSFAQVLDAIVGSMSEVEVFIESLGTTIELAIDSMLTGISSLMQDVSNSMSGVIDSISSFFAVLTAPEAAQNIKEIAEAITAIPTTKNLEFVASMAAAAGMATVDAAATSVKAMGSAAAGAVGDLLKTETKTENVTNIQQANRESQEITVNLMLDRDKLATVVERINGENAQNYIASRGS